MVLHAEAHINWISDAIGYLDTHGYTAIRSHCGCCGQLDRRVQSACGGDVVPAGQLVVYGGKCAGQAEGVHALHRGFATYLDICAEVANAGYKGFNLVKAS